MAIQAKCCKILESIVRGVAIDMVNLKRLTRNLADAAGAIRGMYDFGDKLFRNRQPFLA
jgi:hypothetical protein